MMPPFAVTGRFMRTFRFITILALSVLGCSASAQTLTPGFSPDPQTLRGTAGGPVDGSAHGSTPLGGCFGSIPSNPQHVLTLTEHFDWLSIQVTSSGDTTLVVQGPIGWWCTDDTVGLNPGMSGQWAPGTYRVFVGSYNPGENLPYTLEVTSQNPEIYTTASSDTPTTTPVPVIPVQPVVEEQVVVAVEVPVDPPTGIDLDVAATNGLSGNSALTSGFLPDPHLVTGTSGGTVSAAELDIGKASNCAGFVSGAPNHVLTLNSSFNYLRFDVASSGDTTLVLHGPSGWMCNDDTVGFNPRLDGPFVPGTYRIWVGSYDRGRNHDYTLAASEWAP